MKRLFIIIFTFLFVISPLIYSNEEIDVDKYKTLYNNRKYLSVIEVDNLLDDYYPPKPGAVYLRNLVADSYRMLEKYTHAARYYYLTDEGFFDGYSSYCLEILQRISNVKGRIISFNNSGIFKLFDNVSPVEKQNYFKDLISMDIEIPNAKLNLYQYLAGNISLESLLQDASTENIIQYKTYAGLNFEYFGNLKKARELYTQVLEEKSDKIEALLAANRMGLLALKMIYTTFKEYGNLNELTNVLAIEVSSAYLEENRLYSAYNLIDENPKTAWVPVGKNGGIGEWVEISFDDPVLLNGVTIINGYAKSDAAFINNNRVKTATLEFSDGSRKEILLKDASKPQTIKIEKKTRTIRMYINGVYKGTKYDDTCISEIAIDFKELH